MNLVWPRYWFEGGSCDVVKERVVDYSHLRPVLSVVGEGEL
jgi:hypothetical protein